MLEREKTVAEGAGAAGLAAMLHKRLPLEGKKVVNVVCGGNIDVNLISRIIERGLVNSGRMVRFTIAISDRMGSLARVTRVVADARASIIKIDHDRTFARQGIHEATRGAGARDAGIRAYRGGHPGSRRRRIRRVFASAG